MDKGKLKMLLIGGSKGPARSTSEDDDEDDTTDDPRIELAEAIIRAVKAGDAEGLDIALADHYEECSKEHDRPSDEDDDTDDDTDDDGTDGY